MLSIRITLNDRVKPPVDCGSKSSANCDANPRVAVQGHHLSTSLNCARQCLIGRSIIDDQRMKALGLDLLNHLSNRVLLVIRRYDNKYFRFRIKRHYISLP